MAREAQLRDAKAAVVFKEQCLQCCDVAKLFKARGDERSKVLDHKEAQLQVAPRRMEPMCRCVIRNEDTEFTVPTYRTISREKFVVHFYSVEAV